MEQNPGSFDDRLRGLIFGCALGSAVGLGGEGRNAETLRDNFVHDPAAFSYPRPEAHARAKGYPPNDWTCDFDQAVLLMRAVRAKAVTPALETAFAAGILQWATHGFQELGDTKPENLDNTTFRVVGHPEFLADPAKAALETTGGSRLGTTPVIRTLALAALPWRAVLDVVPRMAATTHADQRCAAAALFQALLLAPLVLGHDPAPEHARFPLVQALAQIVDVDQRRAFRQTLKLSRSLEEADLEHPDQAGQVTKTARVTLWAYRQLLRTPKADRNQELFKRSLTAVALCGRNAAENGALAGAVLGAALGLSGLPPDWVAGLPEREWLEAEIQAYSAALPDQAPRSIEN